MHSIYRLQTRQWSDNVIRKETREWRVKGGVIQKEVQVVVTPRVREEVQRHYNCQQLSGAELEDQGEEGTALTHWEKRLFEVISTFCRNTARKMCDGMVCNSSVVYLYSEQDAL